MSTKMVFAYMVKANAGIANNNTLEDAKTRSSVERTG